MAVLGGAAFVIDHGRKVNRDAGSRATDAKSSTEPQSPTFEKLMGVCEEDPKPIAEAASYQAGPDPHYIELMVLEDLGDGFENDDHWSGITGGSYYRSLDDADLTDIELVACLHLTESTFVTRCEMSTYGSNAEAVELDFYAGSGEMVVREAKTGKVVQTNEVPASNGLSCPDSGSTGAHLVDVPYEAADAVLRATLHAGTRPA
ncbi:hypothetical protein [Aquihabitans sp. McL0605]|uniref:hypothetical protein n=1 Tax=Aquihabitans sp. McL0605 TaxID=3415671 RepID=UPI003CF9E16B